MEQFEYWQKQETNTPLFPDIEWSKPEQKSHAGKLVIIGGHSGGFVAVAESYELAYKLGAGQVRAMIPDSLKKIIPPTISDTLMVPSNPSGGFSKEAGNEFKTAHQWADIVLLIGDTGRNSETAIVYETLLLDSTTPVVISRDAFDLLRNSMGSLVERKNTVLVLSFAQVQKLFQAVYYPKILTLNMQLVQLVEALHKFTISYPVSIVTYHNEKIIVSHDGKVSTTDFKNPLTIWRGHTATRIACYLLWNRQDPFKTITTAVV